MRATLALLALAAVLLAAGIVVWPEGAASRACHSGTECAAEAEAYWEARAAEMRARGEAE